MVRMFKGIVIVAVIWGLCCGMDGGSAERQETVCRLAAMADNYVALDMGRLKATGFLDQIAPLFGKSLDEFTKQHGFSPLDICSRVIVWWDAKEATEVRFVAMVNGSRDVTRKFLEIAGDVRAVNQMTKMSPFVTTAEAGPQDPSKKSEKMTRKMSIPFNEVGLLFGDFDRQGMAVIAKNYPDGIAQSAEEEGIVFYRAKQVNGEQIIYGLVEGKAILVGESQKRVKEFWQSLSKSPGGAGLLAEEGEILTFRVAESGMTFSGKVAIKKGNLAIDAQVSSPKEDEVAMIEAMANAMIPQIAASVPDENMRKALVACKVERQGNTIHVTAAIPLSAIK